MVHYPQIISTVTHGRGLGHKIGFPTANIALPEGCGLKFGVYFATVEVEGEEFFSLLSVGQRPTIAEDLAPNAECYILDFDRNIYGLKIIVKPLQYIRAEQRFSSVELLIEQIKKDVATAQQLINYTYTKPI